MQLPARISVNVIMFKAPYLLYTPTLEFQIETYANYAFNIVICTQSFPELYNFKSLLLKLTPSYFSL